MENIKKETQHTLREMRDQGIRGEIRLDKNIFII